MPIKALDDGGGGNTGLLEL